MIYQLHISLWSTPPTKLEWKCMVKKAMRQKVEAQWHQDITEKNVLEVRKHEGPKCRQNTSCMGNRP